MILCCGEALIDMIPQGDAFKPLSGGAAFNTAIGLGRQHVPVALLSGISTDLFGTELVDALEISNVATNLLIYSDRPTTLAFVKLVDGKASYAFFDENTAGRMIHQSDLPNTIPADVTTMLFGGISLAVEPCADTYVEFLKRHSIDSLIMFDPNIRSSFAQDEYRYRKRLNEVIHHTDIIKISDEDLHWLDQSCRSLEEKVHSLFEQGPKLVCLTLGSDGAMLFNETGKIAQSVPDEVDVKDTVGAGDAFNAGFLTHLSRKKCLDKHALASLDIKILSEALAFATAFASDSVTRPGADLAWDFEIS